MAFSATVQSNTFVRGGKPPGEDGVYFGLLPDDAAQAFGAPVKTGIYTVRHLRTGRVQNVQLWTKGAGDADYSPGKGGSKLLTGRWDPHDGKNFWKTGDQFIFVVPTAIPATVQSNTFVRGGKPPGEDGVYFGLLPDDAAQAFGAPVKTGIYTVRHLRTGRVQNVQLWTKGAGDADYSPGKGGSKLLTGRWDPHDGKNFWKTGDQFIFLHAPIDMPGMVESLQALRVAERQRREASATSFYFLHASKVRGCSMERLPRLQDLKRTHPDWIVKKPVDMTSSLLGDYRENMLGTSHRWEHPDEPDTKGTQLAALKRYLDDHPEIEYVWFDFPCMPQKPRSPEDEDEFAEMLSNVNVIFIGMQVLILLDMSYMSRFWTQTEAWMSMQDASTSGLATASEEKRRYTIVPLHNASTKVSETLIDMWAGKSAQEAHDILAQPDVLVTNQSDKDKQLPKILKLNETIKKTLEVNAKLESALQQLAHAMVAKDVNALTAALSVAEKADVAPANLQKGREALAAAQAARGDRQQVLDAFTEAQRVAGEAFDRAQQLAKDKGVEVKLSGSGSTLNVTVKTKSDGKSDSLDLNKVWLEHMVGVRSSEGGGGGGCCVVQ